MAGGAGGVGGVEDRGGVEPDVAAIREAGIAAVPFDMGGDGGFGDATMAVRSGGDEQRGIVGIDRIEMDAQGEHVVEQRLRRGDMLDARLDRPGTKAGRVDTLAHRDGAVLMPTQCPVGGGALVEQDGADGARGCAQMGGGVAADNAGGFEQRGDGGEVRQALAGAVGGERCDCGSEGGERAGVEGGGDVTCAVGGEGEGHALLWCDGAR